jgi:hypothetical protein
MQLAEIIEELDRMLVDAARRARVDGYGSTAERDANDLRGAIAELKSVQERSKKGSRT